MGLPRKGFFAFSESRTYFNRTSVALCAASSIPRACGLLLLPLITIR